MNREIVIYGASGFAREVAQLVRDIVADGGQWNLLGYLDDDPNRVESAPTDLPIIGDGTWLQDRSETAVVIGVGSPAAKRIIAARIPQRSPRPVLVHPAARIGDRVELGPGCVITAGNVLTVDIRLGAFTTVNLACTIGHDAVIEDYSTLSPGVNLSGAVRIGEGCDLGTGSSFVQGVTVGQWSIVGAGAVVASELPANCTAVGVPARTIKQRPDGWHMGTTK